MHRSVEQLPRFFSQISRLFGISGSSGSSGSPGKSAIFRFSEHSGIFETSGTPDSREIAHALPNQRRLRPFGECSSRLRHLVELNMMSLHASEFRATAERYPRILCFLVFSFSRFRVFSFSRLLVFSSSRFLVFSFSRFLVFSFSGFSALPGGSGIPESRNFRIFQKLREFQKLRRLRNLRILRISDRSGGSGC